MIHLSSTVEQPANPLSSMNNVLERDEELLLSDI